DWSSELPARQLRSTTRRGYASSPILWPKFLDAPPPGGACYTILGETAQSSSMRDALASPTPLPSYSRREIVLRRLDQVERQHEAANQGRPNRTRRSTPS